MILYIIRHGKPDYTTDTLTPEGIRQAEAVGKRLYASGIDRVFSSPMGRAKETAAPLCRLSGLEMQIEDWAHEIGDERLTTFPDGSRRSISLLPAAAFRRNGGVDLPYDRAYECDFVRDTQMKTAAAYIEQNGNDFLERLGYKAENGVYRILRPNEEKVALFCHAAFSRAWISILLHIPLHMMWASFDYPFTGVTTLQFENCADGFTAPRCLSYGSLAHLYAHEPEMFRELELK